MPALWGVSFKMAFRAVRSVILFWSVRLRHDPPEATQALSGEALTGTWALEPGCLFARQLPFRAVLQQPFHRWKLASRDQVQLMAWEASTSVLKKFLTDYLVNSL